MEVSREERNVYKKQFDENSCFDLVAGDGLILCRSRNYQSEDACYKAITSVRTNCNVPVEDQTVEGYQKLGCPKYEIYRDDKEELRFVLRDEKGEVIAASAQGFAALHTCRAGILAIAQTAPSAKLMVPTYSKPVEGFVCGQALNV